MSEQTIENPQPSEQLSDVLLVLDKEKKTIQAVTGVDKNGELQTVDADKKNQSQFMRVDRNGDVFSNFFSNFWRQLKNPTHFSFFKVPAPEAGDIAKAMQKQLDTPTKKGEAIMEKHAVKEPKQQQQENKKDMETKPTPVQTSEYRFKEEQIDWETMHNLGLSKERLEKAGVLDTLLRGYKTNLLMPVSLNLGSAVTRMDARLSLQSSADGRAVVAIHGIRKEPNLNMPFFGHTFTEEDKENLLTTQNMGRVVDLTHPKTGEKIASIISIDRLTNEVIALRQQWMKIPDAIKSVPLNAAQKQTLLEGKPLYLEGMISKKGKPFNASVQYNADKRFIEFIFDRDNTNKQTQNRQTSQRQGKSYKAPEIFRGKVLTGQQYEKYNAGETVYVDGLINKKDEKYQGYITFDKTTGVTSFSFINPKKLKEKIQPTKAHKPKVAVNAGEKTSETTQPLKAHLQPKAPAKSKDLKR